MVRTTQPRARRPEPEANIRPLVIALAIGVAACELPVTSRALPYGFTRASAPPQLRLEDRFQALPDHTRIRETHRELTRLPHPAGSVRDRELAEWTARQFRDAGMEDVQITAHEVMLPRPVEISVTMTVPRIWQASLHETPVADRDTHIDPAQAGLPHHAYSASGEIEAPVVYAGYGMPRDYDWLKDRGIDVRGRIVLVRYSMPYSYRGYKAHVAEERGAAGILMYSDPADAGGRKGPPYPDGPWSPDSRIERGGIAYDFFVPGDPLTPGWPSLPGQRRIPRSEAVSLPRIVSVPLSANDAQPILEALDGETAPQAWQGGLKISYRVGGGRTRVRMRVRMDDGRREVWTVTGLFRGAEIPDEVVMLGNHRDAWIYGGVDPSGGSAALIELGRVFGSLARQGWRPKRSILFASWDAEEFALISSTEWGEQHESWLRKSAVAYLNVDGGASGSKFVAGAVPSLARLLTEVIQTVDDPVQRVPVATVARDRARLEGDATPHAPDHPVIDDRLGGGSDYAVFLNHLGIPVADLSFDGPYGVYHSLYDTHGFVTRFADPGFRYHLALVRIWGLAALRLAQADAVPLEPEASASRILEYVRHAESRLSGVAGAPALTDLLSAAANLKDVAASFQQARSLALERQDLASLKKINAQAIAFERAFVDARGLPGRPWFRHVIYAPRFTYEPQTLPGLHHAIDSRNPANIAEQARRLAAALQRAADQLDGW